MCLLGLGQGHVSLVFDCPLCQKLYLGVVVYRMEQTMRKYGNIYMLSTTKQNRKRLQTLQNKSLKCALKNDKKYNTKALHKEANIDPLKVRRIRHTLQHIFQISQANSFTGWKARASIVTRSNKKKLMVLKKPQTKKRGGARYNKKIDKYS